VPRVISFIVLLAIALLVGAIFFQVMAQFFVPLFLAGVLLVVFQPLHAWTLKRLPGHPRISAFLTTVMILLVVLLPLAWLGWNAYFELHDLVVSRQEAVNRDDPAPTVQIQVDERQDANENVTSQDLGEPDIEVIKVQAPSQGADGALPKWLNDTATNLRDQFAELFGIRITDSALGRYTGNVLSYVGVKVLRGVQSIPGLIVGLAITCIALYYFLADGPAMISTVMYLSPLDSRYEKELLERFGEVSRAVVVATLLSALVQGMLAGIGYYFALPNTAPIFLLTALTMVTALVPFVGAAAVWVCVCVWIYFRGPQTLDGQIILGDPMTAIILAVFCTIVVSGIDNVIKPLILHGQSRLHPLLALLSILGGVQVLGPIGILVGPMLVSFLQALLTMLRKELDSFGAIDVIDADTKMQLAGVAAGTGERIDDKASPGISVPPAANSATTQARNSTSAASVPTVPRGGKRKTKR
jgi:predicted PurR-regulated permease PerM